YRSVFCQKHNMVKCKLKECNNKIPYQKGSKQICYNHPICDICNKIFDKPEHLIPDSLCHFCGYYFCHQCGGDKECKLCMLSVESNRVRKPLSRGINTNKLITDYSIKYIVDIITDYCIGITTTCVLCNDYIHIEDKYHFTQNIDCNGKEIYKYKFNTTRSVLDDSEYRTIYDDKKYRIFCHKCNPKSSSNNRCGYGSYGHDACDNMDIQCGTTSICAQHARCVICHGYLILRSCNICKKYYCYRCGPRLPCDICFDKQQLEKKCPELYPLIMPYINLEQCPNIMKILAQYTMGYAVNCNGLNCKTEIVINPSQAYRWSGWLFYINGQRDTDSDGKWIHWKEVKGGKEIIGASLMNGDKYYIF
ncbi:MAG: hypothetical protein SV598_03600, partial [Pseudomonadota bacterium]|nr:hypothetical protein [Pseudomonadota bacterium]